MLIIVNIRYLDFIYLSNIFPINLVLLNIIIGILKKNNNHIFNIFNNKEADLLSLKLISSVNIGLGL